MRILLADDRMEVRSGLRILLEQETGIDVVGEASGIGELLLEIQNDQPDVVLLDWELSNLRLTDLIPILRSICPGLRIIALSGRPESHSVAVSAGVDAFVSKGDQPEKLMETINRIRHNCETI